MQTPAPALLTEKTALSSPPKGKPYEIRDKGGRNSISGLLLRVQPSGKKIWYCQYGRGKRERIGDASVMTLSRARKRAKVIMGKVEEGHDYQTERVRKRQIQAQTLGGFVDTLYSPYVNDHVANPNETLSRLKRSFEELLEKPMSQISEIDIERWRKRRKDVKFETLKRDFTTLKSCLGVAAGKFKIIDTNPLLGVTLRRKNSDPESQEKAPRYLTAVEESKLRNALDKRESKLRQERSSGNKWRAERGYNQLSAIDEKEYADHIKPIVLLALNTGLRRGDIFGLEWRHIDLKLRQIRKVIEKTSHRKSNNKAATIPLSNEAVAIVKQWRSQSAEEGLVFPSPVTGARLDNINKAWRQILKDSGIEAFRFHDLRHTFASRLVMAGIDLNTVRELMCHSDLKMTLVYAHLSPDHKAAAIEAVFKGIG